MRWAAPALLVPIVACNALVNFGELTITNATEQLDAGEGDDDAGVRAPVPTKEGGAPSLPRCNPAAAFEAPVLLPGPVNGVSTLDSSPSLTNDELTLVFGRTVGTLDSAVLVATRASVDVPFGEPVEIPQLGATRRSYNPSITGDGTAVFYTEDTITPGTLTVTKSKLMVTRKTSKNSAFNAPEPYRTPDPGLKTSPHVTRDGAELYFSLLETDEIHIYRSVADELAMFQEPVKVAELASVGTSEGGIATSSDGLTIYFASSRGPSDGDNDAFVATRRDRSSAFENITKVAELSSPKADRPGWLSVDGCRLYMMSDRTGKGDLYVATKGR